MDSKLRVGVIGVGNMGSAIVRGIVGNLIPPEQVWVTDLSKPLVHKLCTEVGVSPAESISQLMENTDCLLYAAKPNNLPAVLPQIAAHFQPNQWLISIAAGVPTARLESYFASPAPVVRVMPNITIAVRSASSVICAGSAATDDHLSMTQAIFDTVGRSFVREETYLDAVTGLSGSGPAFVFLFVEALADAGVQVGLSRMDASQLAVQTMLGAGRMLEDTKEHPAVLKNLVTTPGGTTAAGLYELERGGFRAIIANSVVAATKRAEALAD